MKIAILAESFLPHMNGVTGSVLQAITHLSARGHELMVVAPRAGELIPTDRPLPPEQHDALLSARLELLRSIPLPSYPAVRFAPAGTARITELLRSFDADVVHLASPFVLGWNGVRAADALRTPSVAVYQTDITAYTERYGMGGASTLAARHIARLHRRSTLTLAPSSSAREFLTGIGVDRLRHWGRGVDADRFAPDRRSERWRRTVSPRASDTIVGYVGRLSPEKQVEDLAAVHDIPGVQLVIVGDGPSRAALEQLLPNAHFTGFLGGDALAEAVASFDLFVHPGESETFCQTIQESLASGVPVVATGRGGPVDLVSSSVNGWLYAPGDLNELRSRVADLVGDPAKRAAFASSARLSVRTRTWSALCDQLVDHYEEAIELRMIDTALLARPQVRPRSTPQPTVSVDHAPRWRKYVALGDSITEGLGDTSRMPEGEYLGWAERLAMLLADERSRLDGVSFANLAVRSRRVGHLAEQVDRALPLRPDLVSVLLGSNDLVLSRVDIDAVAAELEHQVRRLRNAGIDVLLGTPFLPRRRIVRVLAPRFAHFTSRIRSIALEHECLLLDVDSIPEIGDLDNWADDRVHLASSGHRLLAYRAAELLGVPHAGALSELEHALHDPGFADTDVEREVSWLRAHALPWAWRRLRGRTAGDGLQPKHDDYVVVHARGVQ